MSDEQRATIGLVGSTWIHTTNGPRRIGDLRDQEVRIYGSGPLDNRTPVRWRNSSLGSTLTLRTEEGYSVQVAPMTVLTKVTHEEAGLVSQQTPAQDLQVGDRVGLHSHAYLETDGHHHHVWGEPCRATESGAYLLATLIGTQGLYSDRKFSLAWTSRYQIGGTCFSRWPDLASRILRYDPQAVLQYREHIGAGSTTIQSTATISSTRLEKLFADHLIIPNTREVTPAIDQSSFSFHRGFLTGILESRVPESVSGNKEDGYSFTMYTGSRLLLSGIQRMLLRLGIVSALECTNNKKHWQDLGCADGVRRAYLLNTECRLKVRNTHIVRLGRLIGNQPLYQNTLNFAQDRVIHALGKTAKISQIEHHAREESLYHLQLPPVSRFDANGFVVSGIAS